MTAIGQVFKCAICGNIVTVLHAGGGQLVCCGKPMDLQNEKTADEGKEKHVPVIEQAGNDVVVRLGAVPHPMLEAHHIEWIELVDDQGVCQRRMLAVTDAPEAHFVTNGRAVSARAYCNLHGLWRV